jgi:hypothetical protein
MEEVTTIDPPPRSIRCGIWCFYGRVHRGGHRPLVRDVAGHCQRIAAVRPHLGDKFG